MLSRSQQIVDKNWYPTWTHNSFRLSDFEYTFPKTTRTNITSLKSEMSQKRLAHF